MCYACVIGNRSEEHTSELQSPCNLVCRLLLEKKYLKWAAVAITCHWCCTDESVRYSNFAPVYFFFFNDTATTEIYTLSLHDALPICAHRCNLGAVGFGGRLRVAGGIQHFQVLTGLAVFHVLRGIGDFSLAVVVLVGLLGHGEVAREREILSFQLRSEERRVG